MRLCTLIHRTRPCTISQLGFILNHTPFPLLHPNITITTHPRPIQNPPHQIPHKPTLRLKQISMQIMIRTLIRNKLHIHHTSPPQAIYKPLSSTATRNPIRLTMRKPHRQQPALQSFRIKPRRPMHILQPLRPLQHPRQPLQGPDIMTQRVRSVIRYNALVAGHECGINRR